MPRDRTSRLLDEFTAVTDAAPRPTSRRITMRSRFPVATLSAASLVIVVVAVAALVLGRSAPTSDTGSSPRPSTHGPSAQASAPSAQASTPSAQASTPSAGASVEASGGPCTAADLAARIMLWEGAAGQRIADVDLTNHGRTDCLLDVLARPQLVDGTAAVLIDGPAPGSSGQITLAPGAVVKTLVAAGNWCKPAPQPPVSVAFVFADGQRVIADPLSPNDATMPPCNGAGVPATIAMHPWAP